MQAFQNFVGMTLTTKAIWLKVLVIPSKICSKAGTRGEHPDLLTIRLGNICDLA
jgi:hypothetical protein